MVVGTALVTCIEVNAPRLYAGGKVAASVCMPYWNGKVDESKRPIIAPPLFRKRPKRERKRSKAQKERKRRDREVSNRCRSRLLSGCLFSVHAAACACYCVFQNACSTGALHLVISVRPYRDASGGVNSMPSRARILRHFGSRHFCVRLSIEHGSTSSTPRSLAGRW